MAKKNNIVDDWQAEAAKNERFNNFYSRGPLDEFDTNIARADFRYKIGDVECVPSGDVIAIAGKPGVGKSTALAILIGVLIGNKEFGEISCVTPCKRVLWIDTEKGHFSCIKKINTLKKVAGFDESKQLKDCGVDFFSMKDELTEDRLFFVEALSKKKDDYDVYVIDGIFDLTDDPDKNYTPVIDLLKNLTRDKASVFAVLHTNKQEDDDNMRYAIGTELQRICTTRFTIKYNRKKKCHDIIHDKSNDTEIAPTASFKYDENGIPVPFIEADGKDATVNKDSRTLANEEKIKSVLSGGVVMSRKELIQKLGEGEDGLKKETASKAIQNAKNSGLIAKEEGKYGKYYLVEV